MSSSIVFGFWKKIARPCVVLAPMADVTDYAFRTMIAKYSRHGQPDGGPDVFWTEFISADGLCHPVALPKLMIDARFSQQERPIVVQLFGNNPETMAQAVEWCKEQGFDGIDINMGCPERTIVKQGAGCGMILDPDTACRVIASAQQSAGDIPVSVKTRIGFQKNEIDTWIRRLLEMRLPVLTVHLRTRKDMSKVPAKWHLMKDIIALRDAISPETLIIGNGDITTPEEAYQKIKETGCDGVMIGRGVFGNPWLFDRQKKERTVPEILEVMLEHTRLFVETLGQHKSFHIMKKHYKAYCHGFPGAKELRVQLMEQDSYESIETITRQFLENYHS